MRHVDLLARLSAVLTDRVLTKAERIATAIVILHANAETGQAFPSHRRIHELTGVGHEAIAGALGRPGKANPPGKAIGRHLEVIGHIGRGCHVYQVLPPQGKAASASVAEALTQPSASVSGGQRFDPAPASASVTGGQRFGRRSAPVNGELDRTGGTALASPSGSLSPAEDHRVEVGRLVTFFEQSRGESLGPAAGPFADAARKALAAGTPPALIQAFVDRRRDLKPWECCHGAARAARDCLAASRRLTRQGALQLQDIERLAYDVTTPDGFAAQADLEDLKRRWADVLEATRDSPGSGRPGQADVQDARILGAQGEAWAPELAEGCRQAEGVRVVPAGAAEAGLPAPSPLLEDLARRFGLGDWPRSPSGGLMLFGKAGELGRVKGATAGGITIRVQRRHDGAVTLRTLRADEDLADWVLPRPAEVAPCD